MAFPGELALRRGITLQSPHRALERTVREQPQAPERKYTDRELTRMMFTLPQGLQEGGKIDTPAGTWTMESGVPFFDPKPEEKLREISIPTPPTRRERLVKLLKDVSMMY